MTRVLLLSLAVFLAAAPSMAKGPAKNSPPPIDAKKLDAIAAELVKKHGAPSEARVKQGLAQVAALWTAADGDLAEFARANFLSDEKQLDATFARLESVLEQLDGHGNEMGRELRRGTELDVGPLLAVDPLLAAYEPRAHLNDDLFKAKVAFLVLLNFPQTTLAERLAAGKSWSRRRWAEARLTGRFQRRVPSSVDEEQARTAAASDLYIAQYNVWMHHLLDEKGERLFGKGLRLISHWNLRDELKADYADPRGLDKQRMIVKVMERIVAQEIPRAVIDDPRLDWNPFTNQVTAAPASEIEADAPKKEAPAVADVAREPDTRYRHLLENFAAARAADPYSPTAKTAIARSFDVEREIPEERVKALLTEILESPLAPRVAAEIQRKLGRKLEPQDLWYNGFVARASHPESELDALTRKRYPTPAAFAADIPRILVGLGFGKERAAYLAAHIVVDPSRGAGHAMQAERRGDLPHLRTRVEKDGMNYKGYNIAVHELGHNVEQVFSLYDVDHTLLRGIPNNSFTEALAFLFQARDLTLLGLGKPDAEAERARVLGDFWQAWEIAGVALVDVAVWHWMYDHPGATPAQLRAATVKIARDEWKRHYAPLLGGDSAILGIYSHMISYPLYLADYPLGHLIAFQLEEHMAHAGNFGAEFERVARLGSIAPDAWMVEATGAPVAARPLLDATERALQK